MRRRRFVGKKLIHGRRVGSGYAEGSRPTQFVKGRSGNLGGREKGIKNLSTHIEKELNARVPITENGRSRTITKGQAIAKQLINKAASGDPKAIPLVLNQTRHQEEAKAAAGLGPEILLQPEDDLVIENIIKRIRESDKTTSETASDVTAPSAIEIPTSETNSESPQSTNLDEDNES
jgi:hypothetical protein